MAPAVDRNSGWWKLVAGCWVGSIEHWRQSSSFDSVAFDAIGGLEQAIRTGALDLPETGNPCLLSQEGFVHYACQ